MTDNPSHLPEDEESTNSDPPALELPSEELLDNLEQTISLSAAEEEALEKMEGSDPSANTLDLSYDDTGLSQPFGMAAEPGDVKAKDKTISDIGATIDLGSVQLRPEQDSVVSDGPRPSVMQSSNLSQTINPRELSKEDMAFWGSVAQGASQANQGEQTRMKPAIERSISETNLQIRERDLAAPTRDPGASSDYRLIRLLGRGGMGNVYVAKQTSLDRVIAVKVIKPLAKAKREKLRKSGRLETVENDRRQQFLSEAVVTSDLDHPNIVPIHDIAVASDDTLFYAMKRVVGEPWSKTIDEKSRDENLEILLKVCDAIAFAHTRGVVHRDIKPENVMLGNFGEVLVMDWGLALAQPDFEKKDSITSSAGLGGTPAFMSPEMAKGPIEAIGPASDVYLLGATLFYIVTGGPPHKADNVSLCVRACANNEIQEPLPEHEGELLEIAMQAMATNVNDRFASVKEFQEAIRDYRSHSESIAIASAAATDYEQALKTASYESYSRATHGFEQAIGLWSGNEAAIDGLARCKVDYAKAAHNNGDYDLGLSLLDEDDHRHVALISRIRADAEAREQRADRLRLFRFLAIAAGIVIVVGGSVALFVIEQKRSEAERQRKVAEEQTGIAEAKTVKVEQQKAEIERQRDEIEVEKGKALVERDRAQKSEADAIAAREGEKRQREIAEEKTREAEASLEFAVEQKGIAEKARDDAKESQRIAEAETLKAEQAEREAVRQRQEAEYEYYLSQIGLAKARIDGNEFDDARRILRKIGQTPQSKVAGKPAWEWRWLWQQAHQSESDLALGAPVVDLAVSLDDGFLISVCSDGSIHRSELAEGRLQSKPTWRQSGMEASCVAIDRRSGQIAIGNELGEVLLIRPDDGTVVNRIGSHDARTTDLAFLPDSRLVSSSNDRTVALWLVSSRKRVDRCWHISAVREIAVGANDSQNGVTVVAAVGNERSGRAVGWKISGSQFKRLGEFQKHRAPIGGIALSPDGELAASGDRSGQIYLWRPADLETTDYQSEINKAITEVEDSEQLISTRTRTGEIAGWKAHPDAVSALRFDDSGSVLLSGSDDYTIRIWNPQTRSLRNTLRGHGGWVRSLDLAGRAADGSRRIVSGSVDGSVRIWDPTRVSDPTLVANRARLGPAVRDKQVHGDEILAARIDPAGRKVITASRDHTARILGIDRNTMSFKELARINTRKDVSGQLAEGSEFLAMSARVDRVGNRLFVGSADSIIRVWDLETGTELSAIRGTGLNTAFAMSADGSRLLTGSSDPNAKALLWDTDRRRSAPRVLHRIREHRQAVTAFALSADGKFAVTGDRGGRCLLWDAQTMQRIGEPIDDLRGFRINEIQFANDDQSIWVASDNGTLTEFGLRSRNRRRILRHEGFVTAVALSPDGRTAVTLSEQTTDDEFKSIARLWDLRTENGQLIDEVVSKSTPGQAHTSGTSRFTSARFGERGRRVVMTRRDPSGRAGTVLLFDVATKISEPMKVPSTIGAPETGILLDDDQLITLNGEAAFRWDLERRVHTKSYRPHAAVTAACFSPDGMVAATASRSVRFWDSETGQGIDKLEAPHAGPITSLDFSRVIGTAGYLIGTSGNDSSVRLWTWRGRETGFLLRRELSIDGARMTQVRFSNDGLRVMGASVDGRLGIWNLMDESAPVQFALPEAAEITCAEFSSDDRWLAVGTDEKIAWLFDVRNPNTAPIKFEGHADRIESVAIVQDAPNQLRLLTASRDKSFRVWDPRFSQAGDGDRSGREVLSLRRHSGGVTAIDSTKDGDLVMTAARDGRLLLWPAAVEVTE